MSTINTNSINVNYPVPGINNSSQGFRDNFTSIKTNLDTAGNEITDLQNVVVVKSALANTTVNNDMANTLISNASIRSFRATTYNLGSSLSGTLLINTNLGDVQYGTIAANTTIQFAGWAPTGTQSNIQLQLTIANTDAVVTFPTNVSMTGSYGIETVENFANVAGVPTVTAAAGVSQLDFRLSTVDCGNTIFIEPYNRPRRSTQVQARTPSPIGLPGDQNGAMAVDPDTTTAFATCTNSTTTYNYITCDSTEGMYLNMPVTFYGTTFGGVTAGTTYYVRTIPSSTRFTISATPSTTSSTTSAVALSTASGTMYVTPVSYLYIAAGSYDGTSNSRQVTTTTSVETSTYSTAANVSGNITVASTSNLAVGQPITFSATPTSVSITQTYGSTERLVVSSASGMVVGQKINISGTTFGGLTTGNFFITYISGTNISISTSFGGSDVNLSDATGLCTGTIGYVMGGLSSANTYYISSISGSNIQVATYQDSAPVSLTNENGNMSVTATTNYTMTLNSAFSDAQFSNNAPIVFTGNTFGGVTANAVYYLTAVDSANTKISVSASRYNGVAGPKVVLTDDSSANHSGQTFVATSYNGENIWKRSEFKGW